MDLFHGRSKRPNLKFLCEHCGEEASLHKKNLLVCKLHFHKLCYNCCTLDPEDVPYCPICGCMDLDDFQTPVKPPPKYYQDPEPKKRTARKSSHKYDDEDSDNDDGEFSESDDEEDSKYDDDDDKKQPLFCARN